MLFYSGTDRSLIEVEMESMLLPGNEGYKPRECEDVYISHIFKSIMTWAQALNFKL